LLLYRPGYEPPGGTEADRLAELDEAAIGDLLEAHLGSCLPVVGALVRARAEGNPFYVEELIRHLIESGILAPTPDGYTLAREPESDDLPEASSRS